MRLVSTARSRTLELFAWVEGRFFDWTRRVRTGAGGSSRRATDTVGPPRDGQVYLPARARNVVSALSALPVARLDDYTFIDLGSGKGKVVFIAAERPFHRVIGVEYSAALHEQAQRNLRSLRPLFRRASEITLLHADAASYEFPAGPLVLHLFNPFGPDVMERMLTNLQASLRAQPRHVVIVMLWPELSGMVEQMSGMRLHRRTRRFDIFEFASEPDAPAAGKTFG